MKDTKRAAFALILALALIVAPLALAEAVDNETKTCGEYTYTVKADGTANIELYNSKFDGVLKIPATLNGVTVTSIGYQAFAWGSRFTGVIIPESVTAIGYQAFANCSNLKSVSIPDGVKHIGEGAFSDCYSLTRIEVSKEHKYFAIIQGALYEKAGRKLLALPLRLNKTTLNIPNGTRAIGECALSDYYTLTDVTIPDSVTSIGRGAFSGCPNLTGIAIPKNVEFIGEGAFSYCKKLSKIEVSDGNKYFSVVNGALCDKSGETFIYMPSGLSVDNYAVPEGVKTIGEYAFGLNQSIKNVTIPDSVTAIGKEAFCYSSLTSVIIPAGVKIIDESAFESCYDLENVTISNGVRRIGDSAFARCDSLTNVVIPDGVKWIGEYAFSWCISLKNITIPQSVTHMGEGVFYGCNYITASIEKGSCADRYIRGDLYVLYNTVYGAG